MVMRHYLGRLTPLVLTGFTVALTFLIPTQAAADDDAERQTLKALRGVGVLVPKLDPEVERDGLAQSTLQTDVEVKLRQAGIRVLTNTEAQSADAGAPYLSLRMGERRNSQGLYAFYLQLELKQFVTLRETRRCVRGPLHGRHRAKLGPLAQRICVRFEKPSATWWMSSSTPISR